MKDVNRLPFTWKKIKKVGLRAGKEALALAEACFKTVQDSRLSWKQKGLLVSALVYFLSPIDAVPDFLPGGYLDDLSLLVGALVGVGSVGREHWKSCRKKYGLNQSLEHYVRRHRKKGQQVVDVPGRRLNTRGEGGKT